MTDYDKQEIITYFSSKAKPKVLGQYDTITKIKPWHSWNHISLELARVLLNQFYQE